VRPCSDRPSPPDRRRAPDRRAAEMTAAARGSCAAGGRGQSQADGWSRSSAARRHAPGEHRNQNIMSELRTHSTPHYAL